PGALALAHAAEKAAGLAVRAAVLGKARERLTQRIDEHAAQAPGGPGFQRPQVELQADDREARVQRGTDIDRTIEDAHECCLRKSYCSRQLAAHVTASLAITPCTGSAHLPWRCGCAD